MARAKIKQIAILLSAATCFTQALALADVPRLIRYEGRLSGKEGQSLRGKHTVIVRLYDAATGGNLLWEEKHSIDLQAQDNGVFALILGGITPFPKDLSFNAPLWLSQEVDAAGESAPRQLLAAAGYALNTERLDGMSAKQLIASARSTPPPNLSAADLPLHARLHQPGATDALATGPAVDVGGISEAGAASAFARADHIHRGVHTLAAKGEAALSGDIVLAAGNNTLLTQQGQAITIDALPSVTRARRTVSAANPVALAPKKSTGLLSETLPVKDDKALVLILATVELVYTAVPTNKTVEVHIARDGVVLDTYSAQMGTAARAVSEIPVTVHASDSPGPGPHSYALTATTSEAGVEARERRLTLLELP